VRRGEAAGYPGGERRWPLQSHHADWCSLTPTGPRSDGDLRSSIELWGSVVSDLPAVLQRLGLPPETAAVVIASANAAPPLTADQSARINTLFRSATRPWPVCKCTGFLG